MSRRLVLVVVLLALCGCAGSTAGDGFELEEFSILGPGDLDVGNNTITVTNTGMYTHTLVVTDGSGQVVGATSLVQPGETASLDLDLAPGQYSFTCRIVAEDPDGNIIDHYEAGMNALVDVDG
ncbi:MAG TPA: cupredoxin domain-containing protein [Acidimicrobiia bacterium]